MHGLENVLYPLGLLILVVIMAQLAERRNADEE